MSRGGGPVSTATGTLSRNALYIGGGWRSPSGTAGIEIAQEEIFGPVLAVIPVDGVDDAVRVANDSDYGLSGAVWAGDPAGAVAVAARSRTGQVSVQLPVDAAGTTTVPTAP